MDKSFFSTSNSSSEVSIFNTSYATTAQPTTSESAARQSVPAEMVAAVGLVVFIIGICANSMVLAVLVRARRHFGSSVHTLIANQSVMDLFACVFGASTLVLMMTHGYRYNGNRILDGAICVISGK